jgi:hypothetical protein
MPRNQLHKTQQAFKHWRMNKKSGEAIPEVLWDLVYKLILSQDYKPSIIGKELGISTAQLRRQFPTHYCSRNKPENKTVATPQESAGRQAKQIKKPATQVSAVDTAVAATTNAQLNFVEASLEPVLTTSSQALPILTLQRSNGTKLTLDSLSYELMTEVLTQFMAEN